MVQVHRRFSVDPRQEQTSQLPDTVPLQSWQRPAPAGGAQLAGVAPPEGVNPLEKLLAQGGKMDGFEQQVAQHKSQIEGRISVMRHLKIQ